MNSTERLRRNILSIVDETNYEKKNEKRRGNNLMDGKSITNIVLVNSQLISHRWQLLWSSRRQMDKRTDVDELK
jgi:hypothetical protein